VTRVTDWRLAPASEVVPLIETEMRTWMRELSWDVTDAWHVIEPAREAGQLPGFLARGDDGRCLGWSSHLRHRDSLQVMTLVSEAADTTQALVDATLASDEARGAGVAIVCVRDGAPTLSDALVARGFTVEPYRYMALAIDRVAGPVETFESWPPVDDEVAHLFERAYADQTTIRAFAPNGSAEEWAEYVGQLRKGPGCGYFLPELSRVVPGAAAGRLDGAILVTHLGPGTLHIAQLAVCPEARRAGLARRLVTSTLRAAAGRYARMTLLVSGANHAGGALYESLGFSDLARFVVGTRRA
jgi:ribosomal protein S18 acetylase RimI-like enzyme